MRTTRPQFNDVYAAYHDKVRRYLEQLVGKDHAEDLTQEVFLKIDKGLQDFQGRSGLSTWVYRIATNAATDRVRSRSFQEAGQTRRLDAQDEAGGGCAGVEEESLSAEREAIRNEMTACIREFVARLPPDYRTVIVLSEIKDLRNRQIAEILGIRLDAVKIRLHRARRRLKEEFEAGCQFYRDEDGNLACDRKKNPEAGE